MSKRNIMYTKVIKRYFWELEKDKKYILEWYFKNSQILPSMNEKIKRKRIIQKKSKIEETYKDLKCVYKNHLN